MKPTRLLRHALIVLGLVLVSTLLGGCAVMKRDYSSQADVPMGGGAAQAPAQPERAPGDAAGGDEADRLVIRTKTLRLLVDSTPEAIDQIRALAKTHSGIVTEMQVATDTDEWLYRYDRYGSPAGDGAALRGWVTVRVPADGLEAFTDDVIKLGTLKFQSEASSDVTQEHVDLTARLENLRAQEARLREMFASAKDVTEMLAIEQELWRVRGEIESLDAQVKYLERQAAMATVTIELTEPRPVVRPNGDSWGFVDAITNGFRGAADVLGFSIAIVIATSPLWILGLLVFFLVRGIRRRRREKSGAATAATAPAPAPVGPPTRPQAATQAQTQAPIPAPPDASPAPEQGPAE